MAWDVLFSYPLMERDTNPKLDGLLDICAGMLLKSRWPLKQYVSQGKVEAKVSTDTDRL